jgi:hypothetical protein
VWPIDTKTASISRLFATIMLSALFSLLSTPVHAAKPTEQPGEDRWVPSAAFIAGFTIQEEQKGAGASFIREGTNPDFTPLREPVAGDDKSVAPFVGGSFELMSPTIPIPTGPRFFFGGEILPTFAPGRNLAVQGNPDCVRGPEPGSPCASDEDGSRRIPYSAESANGTGTEVEARIGTMTYGAHLGVAFPFEFAERQFRIKPSFGWINFKMTASGLVVDAACDPTNACTDFSPVPSQPPLPGFLRETILSARDSQRFNGIGPALDLEMDAGRFGPLGVSLFIGGRAYYILDDQTIDFETTQFVVDQIGSDEYRGVFSVELDEWIYRAHIGVRVHFVGSQR